MALVALAAALPSSAPAATNVSINGNVLRAISDPGENNEIQIDLDVSGSDFLVEDGTEGVNVAAPCVLVASHAECPLGGGNEPRIISRSGDRRDTITEGLFLILLEPLFDAEGFPPILFKLGPGNDLGQTGLGASRILGGTGNDRMFGLDGRDILNGGPGNDVLDRQATRRLDRAERRARPLHRRSRGRQDQGPRLHPRPADLLRPRPRQPQPRSLRPAAERLP